MGNDDISRRRVLQILTSASLAVTITLPSRWVKPIVESVVVPAHAQASPNTTPLRGTTGTGTGTSTTSTTPAPTSSPPPA
jgi:hypothetical protein